MCLYCGLPDNSTGGSGIQLSKEDPPYVRRVKTYAFNFIGRSFFVQPRVVWRGCSSQYDVLVCEGSIRLLSSIVVLLVRRLLRRRNIIWAKGWPYSHQEGKLIGWIRGAFLRLAHAYIVYGTESKKNLLSYGIPENRIMIAQNTVDIKDLLNRDGRGKQVSADSLVIQQILDQNEPYIFNIGRHIPRKRILDLVKAMHILQSQGAIRDVGLVIAGTGPQTETLKQLAKDLKLRKIYFVGQVSDNDARELFLRSICCVFPGAVGLALNQAMACGKAVICADEPGPDSELVVHALNGLRYRPGSTEELVDRISSVIGNRELQRSLGNQARHTVRTMASMENMVDRYVAALRSSH